MEPRIAETPGVRSSDGTAEPGAERHDQSTAAFAPGDTVETKRPGQAPGAVFGRYQLIRLLGQGGMGAVHLAHDSLLQREVALKIPRFADDAPIHRERFLREARSAALLTHPNICPVYDVGEIDGQPYLTMAYVEGLSLAERLREGPLDPHEAARLVAAVAQAMQHAHEHGILHRDLKPGNVLLNRAGEPVVMDFGLAFRFDADTSERLTEQGLVVGTPAYMPPEQVNGQALGPAADIYGLGVVLYQLLTGKLPFEGPLGKLLAQIESAAPPPPSQHRPGLEPALEAICLRALAKRPADRFQDMAEFAQALDDYLRGKATLTHLAAPTMLFRPPRKRWPMVATVALAVLLLAGAGIAAVLWLRQGEREIAPVAPIVRSDFDRVYEALTRSMVKIQYTLPPEAPVELGRRLIPPSVLQIPGPGGVPQFHAGPLYFSVDGGGIGHILDLTDQPGQAGEIVSFAGELTVKGPYLLFLGKLSDTTRLFIKGDPGYCILAPMNGGSGSRHVEFDGTHFLLPKLDAPEITSADTSTAERAALRNPDLIKKTLWKYQTTQYVIYNRPGTQVVPGNHELRRAQFPDVYDIIEADRKRQATALTISYAQIQAALRAAGKN